jgi:hypothetical protein
MVCNVTKIVGECRSMTNAQARVLVEANMDTIARVAAVLAEG